MSELDFMNDWFSLEVMKLYILCSMLTSNPRKMAYTTEPKYLSIAKEISHLGKLTSTHT
jgi:hypothetical protein